MQACAFNIHVIDHGFDQLDGNVLAVGVVKPAQPGVGLGPMPKNVLRCN